jgi:hypothetical protein
MFQAITLILLAAAYRMVAATNPALINFSPLMALTFCGAVYFRSPRMWLVPVLALLGSDICLNWYYASVAGYPWDAAAMIVRFGCFVAALGLGWAVSKRKNWATLFGGALAGSLLFYIATNTAAWLTDPFYAQTSASWWQVMTVGTPGLPPTILFFRNTIVSDLIFTGLFALVMERAALKAGEQSLIRVKA